MNLLMVTTNDVVYTLHQLSTNNFFEFLFGCMQSMAGFITLLSYVSIVRRRSSVRKVFDELQNLFERCKLNSQLMEYEWPIEKFSLFLQTTIPHQQLSIWKPMKFARKLRNGQRLFGREVIWFPPYVCWWAELFTTAFGMDTLKPKTCTYHWERGKLFWWESKSIINYCFIGLGHHLTRTVCSGSVRFCSAIICGAQRTCSLRLWCHHFSSIWHYFSTPFANISNQCSKIWVICLAAIAHVITRYNWNRNWSMQYTITMRPRSKLKNPRLIHCHNISFSPTHLQLVQRSWKSHEWKRALSIDWGCSLHSMCQFSVRNGKFTHT